MFKLNYNEKENDILDASTELFIKYGYDKTTVAEIAKNTGISKGAIYLHFNSKEQLFESLLFREIARHNMRWFAMVEKDPEGGLLSGMYKNQLKALSGSKLMTAIFKKDSLVLGSYVKKKNSFFRTDNNRTMRADFVKMMQEAGAIRKDADPVITAHIMDMIGFSLVSMNEFKASEDIPPINDVINGIADFIDRALTPEDGGNSEAGKEVLRQLISNSIKQYEEQESEGICND